ncbi:metallophosphoesterase [Bacillus thuringiensis]|uniref:Serine/threonine protein phosphatase n=1 Tax=Bacillus thuringiensis HD-771 TaxID=1218175 RepID=A0A9W3JFN4_BACTU|nr:MULTISPECIES: metallophosphoesterase [Bacillus]AFQ17333.1 serine/threonine protein phosphatase [Bacillus thuringiensis HD-771]MEB4895110.1 metallophosphoesterase [Bacillus thuringiensis]MEC2472975.1 metallophosphoesterase [Bacillus thuringiensis]MEC2561356.1 metallophosphoesterase [Bacillus thuringiensis]MEC2644303.1 metallophosphoesterase [Bacillus thuringiensis]
MATIYAISDIHGYYNEMIDSLKNVDLKNKENKIIFLGDYVDGGNDSCKVLYYIKELHENHVDQVIVLVGNHDEVFLHWLYSQEDDFKLLFQEPDICTFKSFLTVEEYREIFDTFQPLTYSYEKVSEALKEAIKKKHGDLLKWLLNISKQLRYFETDQQIFVHAGILEEAEDLWKHGTPKEYFTQKYPAETGYFYKDIIAGHISSVEIANKKEYLGKVYWDGESHFYIDGTVEKSGNIPVLKYDTEKKRYSTFEKDTIHGEWREVYVDV